MRENAANIYPSSLIAEDTRRLSIQDETEDFSMLLTSLGVEYNGSQYYWQVGTISKIQGWILHLSVIKTQLTALVNLVIPLLVKENVPFKIARNRSTAEKLINGNCGTKYLAKVISIYPATDQQGADLASLLIPLTGDFKGPAIPTDFCLRNIVYTRYGSFSPVWVKDERSTPVKHIHNNKGELIPDPYSIPFSFPPSIPWPFHHITDPVLPEQPKLLNARYYPISTIKRGIRGNVFKAIYFKQLWNIKACVIKQGRKNMGVEKDGRNVADRLRWQFDLCSELEGLIPIPKVFDYFTENGDVYLAMEFIQGKTVGRWLEDIFKNRAWFDLPSLLQKQILQILLKIVDTIRCLHEKRLVHRDITQGNFIITKNNKAIPIDLELTWSLDAGMDSPPFLLGTPGYMSPQQAGKEVPTVKDDIYALGALIMECCTNLNPTKISATSWLDLQSSLLFFTHDERLSHLVADCLYKDPSKRPNISNLQDILASCLKPLSTSSTNTIQKTITTIDHSKLKWTIQAGLSGLASPEMLSKKSRWISVNQDGDASKDSEQSEIEQYDGWHTGMSGPLWLVALANSAGFSIEACSEAYKQSWEYITSHYFKDPSSANPSLYYGGAGIALALSEGLNSGLLPPDADNLSRLQNCLSPTTTELTLCRGISGQGIAAIHVSPWLNKSYAKKLLASYVNNLLHTQQLDGSWNLKVIGLDDGIAGIIWFLLAYLEHSSDYSIEPCIAKALNWLITDKVNRSYWRRLGNKNAHNLWCNSHTTVDITWLMIRAFEAFGEIRYKQLALQSLQQIPNHLVDSNFTLDSGLARIGELYLEAYRVFHESIWLDKATWIANLFLNTFIPRNHEDGYWYVRKDMIVTADLYTGNSGVLHFLLRYANPFQIPYVH